MSDYKPRVEDRTKVMIRARLRGAGPERDACIVDLSTRGLAATAENAPQRGDYVELVVGGKNLIGQVKWSSMRRFGVAFRERISVIGLLSGDGEVVTLKAREAVRKTRAQHVPPSRIVRRIEFAVFAAAGAAATFVVADYSGSALHSLDTVKLALAGSSVSPSAPAR